MSRNGRVLAILVTAALSVADHVLALDQKKAITQYVYDKWSPEETLPQVSVTAIAQTRDGYLWLGTAGGGLARFDGVRFTVFDMGNTPELRNNEVLCLLADKGGGLWVGTNGGGLSHLEDGRFTLFTTKDGLSSNRFKALLEDRAGVLWIGTLGGGLNRLKDGKLSSFTTGDGLVDDNVISLFEDRGGSLWIGTAKGLSRLKDGKLTTFTTKDGLSHDWVNSIREDRGGSLWIGTPGGLSRFRDGTFTSFTTKDGLSGDRVRDLVEDRDGNLWIATIGGGLSRFRDGRFTSFTTKDGLAGDLVICLLEDREGSLWIGSGLKGLSRLRDGKITSFTEKEGLSGALVSRLLEGRDGSVWISDGLHLDRLEQGKFTSFTFTRKGQAPAAADQISWLHEGRDGCLWIGTQGRGLSCLKDGRLSSFTTKDGLSSDTIWRLLEDREGSLWIGTPNGLNRLKDGRFTTFTTKDGLSSSSIGPLHEDREGSLWIGTAKGLNRMRDGSITTFTAKTGPMGDSTDRLFQDRAGSLWITSSYLGLNRLKDGGFTAFRKDEAGWLVFSFLEDRGGDLWVGTPVGLHSLRGEKLTSITARQGLCEDVAFTILEDGQDNLWMSGAKGICRASRKELRAVAEGRANRVSCASFGTADGMKSAEGNEAAGIRTRDGRLWFPTVNGVVVVDPARLPTNTVSPPVLVEEVLVDGKVAPRLAAGSPLRVPPGAEKLEIHYTALSLAVPKRVRFKVRLQGFDRDWVEAGTERVAHYSNLPPRHYTFRVIACNDDGLWNETGASLRITLLPRFWQTWWFRGLEGLAGLGAFAGALLLQRRRLDRRKARELGDELRAADLARKTEELEHARRVQLALLPKEPLTVGDWTVAGGMQTATEVGGDYYGYLEVGGRLCVVIGDATGHGMASGLVAGMLKSALAALSRRALRSEGPGVWLADLNDALRSSISRRGLGVCLGIGLVDVESGELELGMAGVPHPFHVSASGRVERLQLSGTPLGYLKRLLPATATRTLEPGDRLVLITDGLIEQVNAAGGEWGYAGVEAALASLVASGARDEPAGTIAEELLVACERYGAGEPQSDDRTVVVLARRATRREGRG